MNEIKEAGPWWVGVTEDGSRVFIESYDFTHDVRLYVNGDFYDDGQRRAYADEIAKRLNAWKPGQ